ncbi:MAG TPA: DMT family transporter [Micromonosporaceae bacterium]|nr:DMT family transporter [Micromonosporaceae bacterium]
MLTIASRPGHPAPVHPTATPPAPPRASGARQAVGVAAAAVSGGAIAVQSRINGELGARLHDGIAAATISFLTGMALLLILVPATASGRAGLAAIRVALRRRQLRPWQCLGGVCGAFLVLTQGVTVAALGVAVFTVAMVAGQSASGLLVDRAGVGPTGKHPVTVPRLIGAGLAVVSVGISVADRLTSPRMIVLAALPAVAGLGVAWQQAVNGRVRQAAGSALPAAFVNFVAGTTTLIVVFAGNVAVRGLPSGALPTQWWLYTGGAMGVALIAIAATVVRLTGVLLMGLAMIAGQLLCALIVEVVAPGDGTGPGGHTLLGVALTLVAVGITALPPRWPGQLPTAPRPGATPRPGRWA